MREPKITLAYIKGWDHFDETLYHKYLKAINYVDNTLSGIHWRSMEDIKKDCRGRVRNGSQEDEQSMGKTNHKN